MVVYLTTNMINGKQYIGLDKKNNPSYLGSGLMLKRAIKKYGRANFVKEILQECSSMQEYDGIRLASRITGIKRQSLISALSGKSKTSGGFIWKYKTNVESESQNG